MHPTIPFNFVLDYLVPLPVTVRPMFGLWAIYLDKKIMLVLRLRQDSPESNGVWIATEQKHHRSLKADLPSLRPVAANLKRTSETEWQVIPADTDDFEASVRTVCELIKHNDVRIGRFPVPRQRKRRG